jgi:hypothetical protein
MTPTGFEPAIPEGERSQSHALDRAGTRTGDDDDNDHSNNNNNNNTAIFNVRRK